MKRVMLFLTVLLSAFYIRAEEIEIYHTSDIHGWYMSRAAKWDKENSTRMIGGFAALSSMLKQLNKPYILLDSGDMFHGTPEGNFTKGMASIRYMNALGYAAATVGNHEYNYGEKNLASLAAAANFPLLGANVYEKKSKNRPSYLKPYTIVVKNGKKIAILGLAGVHTKTSTLPKNVAHLNFVDEAAEAEKYAKEIREKHPDLSALIVMPHIGIDEKASQQKVDYSSKIFSESDIKWSSIRVARAAKADVTLGGHNHTGLLYGYKDPVGGLLCESYWGLTEVTKVTLNFDNTTGKLKNATCELIPLWTDIYNEDPEILKITKEILDKVNVEMDKKIGEASSDILSTKDTLDSPIGNWITDIMREYAKVDIAFQNSGGIRNVINKGDVKVRDIYQIMPFENTLVKLTMTGQQIEKLIKDNLKGQRSSMQISGLTVKYRIKGEKISEIILEKDGKKIKPQDKFTVVTNNYLTSGGSGGAAFMSATDMHDTMIAVRNVLIDYVKKAGIISPPQTGRFIRID